MNGWWIFGAVLVLEGVMPLLFTHAWRQTFEKLLSMQDGQIRFVGLMAVVMGVVLIYTHPI